MSKFAKKRSTRAARIEATAATLSPQPMPQAQSQGRGELKTVSCHCHAAITCRGNDCRHDGATGWQPHSMRGFLAGVVRKRLKLQLASTKVDGTRVYRIIAAGSSKPGRKSKRLSA
jgi:choline dehydrogenase-like flavoprotein